LFELGPANFSDFNNVAVLHYEQAPNTNPPEDPSVNIPVSKLPLVETNLHVSRKVSLSDLLIDEVNFLTVQPLTPSPVVRFHFNHSFGLTSSSVVQPGEPVPGGADININLNVTANVRAVPRS
jgi:hypothetical protein